MSIALSVPLSEFLRAATDVPATAEMFIEIAELILVHPANHLLDDLFATDRGGLADEFHLLESIHIGVWFWCECVCHVRSF